MSEDWQEKTLEELCELVMAYGQARKPPFIKVGVIRNTNFTKDGQLDDSDIIYLDVEQSQFFKKENYNTVISFLEKSGGGPKAARGEGL